MPHAEKPEAIGDTARAWKPEARAEGMRVAARSCPAVSLSPQFGHQGIGFSQGAAKPHVQILRWAHPEGMRVNFGRRSRAV